MLARFVTTIPKFYNKTPVISSRYLMDVYVQVTDKLYNNTNILETMSKVSNIPLDDDSALTDKITLNLPNEKALRLVFEEPIEGITVDKVVTLADKKYPTYSTRVFNEQLWAKNPKGFITTDENHKITFHTEVPTNIYIKLNKSDVGITVDGKYLFVVVPSLNIIFSPEEKDLLFRFLKARKEGKIVQTHALDYIILSNRWDNGLVKLFACELKAIFNNEELKELATFRRTNRAEYLFHTPLRESDVKGTQRVEPAQLEYFYKYPKNQGIYYASLAENYRTWLDTKEINSLARTSIIVK